jgi:integrase
MPLKLIPPSARSKVWRIRGTVHGRRVDETTGTADRKVAARILAVRQAELDRNQLEAMTGAPAKPTFAAAVLAYLEAGHDDRFLAPIVAHFGPATTLDEVDQMAVDQCAAKLYPRASAATRNRQVYTPICAVMRRAGVAMTLRRPKGHAGQMRLDYLTPDQAGRVVRAALDVGGPVYAALWEVMLYTGLRLSEALGIRHERIALAQATLSIPEGKTGARAVHLPPPAVAALAKIEAGQGDGRVFVGFTKGGRLYARLNDMRRATGIPPLDHHLCRHTYGTWLRLYGGLSADELVNTGAWKSRTAATRYDHAQPPPAARAADAFPAIRRKNGR